MKTCLAALAVVLVTAGCTGTSSAPSPSGSSSATTSAAGMRGVQIHSLPCPTKPVATEASQSPGGTLGSLVMPWTGARQRPVTGTVEVFWICRWDSSPMGLGEPAIVSADSAGFTALDQALRLPNQPPAKSCTLQGVIQPLVIARTSDGDWVVHLPYDSCGRPRPAVSRAVAQAVR